MKPEEYPRETSCKYTNVTGELELFERVLFKAHSHLQLLKQPDISTGLSIYERLEVGGHGEEKAFRNRTARPPCIISKLKRNTPLGPHCSQVAALLFPTIFYHKYRLAKSAKAEFSSHTMSAVHRRNSLYPLLKVSHVNNLFLFIEHCAEKR